MMKYVFSVLISLFALAFLVGQSSGIVTFTHTIYIDFEGLPSDVPKSFSSTMELKYDKNSSLYQRDKSVVEPEPEGDRRFRRMRQRVNNVTYKKYADQVMFEKIDFLGKDFLVKDSIEKFPWKISAGEQKTICGMMCMKATYQDSTSKYTVFFTPQIPIPTGPDKYGNLPGLILEYQSAKTHIIATMIKPSVENIVFESENNPMSRAEFNKIRDVKMAEQREMWGKYQGGTGNMRIIRN